MKRDEKMIRNMNIDKDVIREMHRDKDMIRNMNRDEDMIRKMMRDKGIKKCAVVFCDVETWPLYLEVQRIPEKKHTSIWE